MRKNLCAIIVILLSLVGAETLAARLDTSVNKVSIETSDSTGSQNGLTGSGGGGRNMVTREK